MFQYLLNLILNILRHQLKEELYCLDLKITMDITCVTKLQMYINQN